MGKALEPDELLRQAKECLELAEGTRDGKLRSHYLKLARDLMELATALGAPPQDAAEAGKDPKSHDGHQPRPPARPK